MSFLNTELFLDCFPCHLPIVFDSSFPWVVQRTQKDSRDFRSIGVAYFCASSLLTMSLTFLIFYKTAGREMRKIPSPLSRSGSEMPAGRRRWCTFIYSLSLSDRLFRFKCNSGIVYGGFKASLCFYTVLFQVQTMKLFSGAGLSSSSSPSGLSSCSPDPPENELLSLTQTHSPDPAGIPLQEFEAQGQVPQLEGTWHVPHFVGGETEARGLSHSLAELLLPVLGIPCLPREDGLEPRLWTRILLPQGLDYVAGWICACLLRVPSVRFC